MIYVIGIGPGSSRQMTPEAMDAIRASDVIVGYKTYIDLIREHIGDKRLIQNSMKQEVERCRAAIEEAQAGNVVSVVSSGDAGVYGMAGLIYELLENIDEDIDVRVIAGVTSATAGAAILGAPLMHDFCNISLSDLLTPWDLILKRVRAAAAADFVICLYNPKSKKRVTHLPEALDIIREYREGSTPVGIAKDIGRDGETAIMTTLDEIDYDLVDMTTTVIIGNSATKIIKGKMVTPRGYHI